MAYFQMYPPRAIVVNEPQEQDIGTMLAQGFAKNLFPFLMNLGLGHIAHKRGMEMEQLKIDEQRNLAASTERGQLMQKGWTPAQGPTADAQMTGFGNIMEPPQYGSFTESVPGGTLYGQTGPFGQEIKGGFAGATPTYKTIENPETNTVWMYDSKVGPGSEFDTGFPISSDTKVITSQDNEGNLNLTHVRYGPSGMNVIGEKSLPGRARTGPYGTKAIETAGEKGAQSSRQSNVDKARSLDIGSIQKDVEASYTEYGSSAERFAWKYGEPRLLKDSVWSHLSDREVEKRWNELDQPAKDELVKQAKNLLYTRRANSRLRSLVPDGYWGETSDGRLAYFGPNGELIKEFPW